MKGIFVGFAQERKDTLILAAFTFSVLICVAGCPFPVREEPIIGTALANNPRPDPGTMRLVSVTPLQLIEVVVRDYDFAFPLGSFQDLRFGADTKMEQLPGEVQFRYASSAAPFVFLEGLEMAASDILAMRVTLRAEWRTAGSEAPAAIRAIQLYWARSEDITPKDLWPFRGRSLRFVPAPDIGPDSWVARFNEHEMWNGTIERMCILVMPNPSKRQFSQSGEGLNVHLRRIEFLGNRYRMQPSERADPF